MKLRSLLSQCLTKEDRATALVLLIGIAIFVAICAIARAYPEECKTVVKWLFIIGLVVAALNVLFGHTPRNRADYPEEP